MHKLLAILLGCVPVLAGAMQGPWECRYGVACVVPLELYEPDGVLPYSGTAPNAVADFWHHCTSTNTESKVRISGSSVDGTFGYAFQVDAVGTTCGNVKIMVRDEDGPGTAFLSDSVAIETCGNAAASRRYCSDDIPTLITSDGAPINATAGVIDTVANVTTADTAVNVTNLESLNATARSQVQSEALAAQSAHRLNELLVNGLTVQPAAGSLWSDLTEDSPISPGTQRFNAQSLAEAPTGSGGGDVNVNSWNGVLLSTTNPLPNAAPASTGGLPTVNASSQLAQPVSTYEVTDKSGYQADVVGYDAAVNFNAVQAATIQAESTDALNAARVNELVQSPLTAQPAAGSLWGDVTQDSVAQPGTQQFTADALAQTPPSPVNAEDVRAALGAFGSTVQTIQDVTNFVVTGPNVPTSAGDLIDQEYTVVFVNADDNNSPSCHRQIQGFSPPTGLLTIPTPCTQNVAIGDEVLFLPNGAGAEIANVNVNNGQVETDLTLTVDGTLSLGCMLSAINAVQTGAQTIVGGTDYTYRNPGDTENRVVATRTASGRAQATITCPAGL